MVIFLMLANSDPEAIPIYFKVISSDSEVTLTSINGGVFVSEIELEIGEVLMIGETLLTVVDIEDEDVTFKIDQSDSDLEMLVTISQDEYGEKVNSPIPR